MAHTGHGCHASNNESHWYAIMNELIQVRAGNENTTLPGGLLHSEKK